MKSIILILTGYEIDCKKSELNSILKTLKEDKSIISVNALEASK